MAGAARQIVVHSTATLGRALRDARRTLGLTQSDLAERSGVSQPMISNIERGQGVSMTTLLRLVSSLRLEIVVQPRPDEAGPTPWDDRG